MLLEILVSVLVTLFLVLLFIARRPGNKQFYFIGPHSSGKTMAMLSLLGLENKTVTTLADHKILFKNKEIFEMVPKDSESDFVKKFRVSETHNNLFFVKNEEELDSFPDLSGFQIKFVMWQKRESHHDPRIIYLNQSAEKLGGVLNKF